MWAGQETSISVIAQRLNLLHSVAHRCMTEAGKIDAIQAGSCRETCSKPLYHTSTSSFKKLGLSRNVSWKNTKVVQQSPSLSFLRTGEALAS